MRHDLTDLRLFLNVGETLNLTRAAERTFLSLPAASARVKNMEEAFKARLLVRMATGVALTPAGEVLLKHANAVFRQLECLNADLQPYASGLKGRLRLLANTTATNSFLADALSTFLAENPDVDVELEEKSPAISSLPYAQARETWGWWRATSMCPAWTSRRCSAMSSPW